MIVRNIARTSFGLTHGNTIVVPVVRIRFQIAPGIEAGLGIAGVDFEVKRGADVVRKGKTDSNGEVMIPIDLIETGGLTLRVFDTDYTLVFENLQPVGNDPGFIRRLDQLGYMQGHLLGAPLANVDPPPVVADHFQAILEFCTDHDDLAITQGAPAPARPKSVTDAGV